FANNIFFSTYKLWGRIYFWIIEKFIFKRETRKIVTGLDGEMRDRQMSEKIQKMNYASVTEAPGDKASKEQLERIYQRYRFVKSFAEGKDVLEVACGSGVGLGYISKTAKRTVGIDVDDKNIALAKKLYKGRDNIEISWMDAHELSFPDNSMDLIFMLEAIYYLREPSRFISEAKRVLRKNGVLMVCSVNKDWEDFHPSPYTHKYFSVPELSELLSDGFKNVSFYGGFLTRARGPKDKTVSLIKKAAVKFNLIPGSLKARAYLKRMFMGKLMPLPTEVYEEMAFYAEPVEIVRDKVCRDYKIIYAAGTKK
ncbi:MAG: class I SAM-dependent methyltransferase, partial [Candidatus Omnitrophota bacterium]